MDVAIAIFNIAAGLGVLAAGGALAYLAWQATPLIRESRALTKDLRRLAHTADAELRPLLANARELTGSVEILSEDAAVKLDRLGDALDRLEDGLAGSRISVAAGRSEPRPVESWETRQDGTDS
jgi:hypothetical protein